MERYYIRHATGQVFGPFDRRAIELMVKTNKIDRDVQLSLDQVQWQAMDEIPDFAHLTDPAPTSVTSEIELPKPKAPSANPYGMPTYASSDQQSSDVLEPNEKTSIAEPDFATQIGIDLDLPPSATQASATEDDLFGDNHTSVDESFLSTPTPATTSEDDLFGATAMVNDEDDLFGATAMVDDEDDLFGATAMVDDEDDLFGDTSSHTAAENNDLFNTQTESPPSTSTPAPTPSSTPPKAHDTPKSSSSLFDSQPSSPLKSEDLFGDINTNDGGELFGDDDHADSDDDLFANPLESNTPSASLDDPDGDFLGGNQAFSFLDDKPPEQSLSESLDDSSQWSTAPGEEKFEQWDEELRKKREATRNKETPESSMPASTGIQSVASTGGKDANIWEDESVQAKKAKRKRIRILVTVLAIVGLAAVGGASYTYLTTTTNTQEHVDTTRRVQVFAMEWSELSHHNYADYRNIFNRAANADLSPAQQGQLLTTEALFLAHYEDTNILDQATVRAENLSSDNSEEISLGLGAYEAVLGDPAKAREYLEPLLETDNNDILFYTNLFIGISDIVQLYSSIANPDENDPDSGIPQEHTYQTLMQAAELKPDNALTHYWIAQWKTLNQDYDGVLQSNKDAVEAGPKHVASRLSLGFQFHQRWQLNHAEEQLEVLINELQSFASQQEKADAYHLLGMLYVARVHNERAIEMLSKAIEFAPERSQTLQALSDEFISARKFNEALLLFTGYLKPDRPNADMLLGIARAHIGLEQWDEATKTLTTAQEAFPEDARFSYYLGYQHMQRGAFNDARRTLQRAIEIDPNELTSYATLAQLAWRIETEANRGEEYISEIVKRSEHLTSKVAVEVAEFYRISDREALARQWYEEAISLDANYWPARVALVQLFLEQGQNDEALEMLLTAKDEGVLDIRLPAYLADAYRQAGQFDNAMENIEEVLIKYPSNEEFLFIRGRIHFDQGNYEVARQNFNRAYEINPLFHQAYFFVGRTAMEQKEYTMARRIFNHVLDHQPNNGEYQYYMGLTFEAEENYKVALEQYRRATDVDPGFGVQNPGVFVHRGRILARLGYFREAKRDLAQALELRPDLVDARIAIGEAEYRERNYVQAIEHFEQAIDHAPEHAELHFLLGMSRLFVGQRQDAISHLQLAVDYNYEDPDVHRTIGFLYKELGQRTKALDAFKTFIRATAESDISNSVRREVLRQITELGG